MRKLAGVMILTALLILSGCSAADVETDQHPTRNFVVNSLLIHLSAPEPAVPDAVALAKLISVSLKL